MKKTQKGFTLIELVIVIVILGILAAFIIPRFGALDKQARIAVVQGMAGSLRGATAIVHGVYLANGGAGGPFSAGVPLDGITTSITMATGGYPTANIPGIISALNTNATNGTITGFTIGTTTGTAGSGTASITLTKTGVTGSCTVTYSETGAVTSDISGC